MSAEDDLFYSKKPFLLTLMGRITVHFIDGQTLDGEIAAQDELNIWLTIDDTPHLIPRNQIRYIKGRAGQPIEREEAQAVPLETPSALLDMSPLNRAESKPAEEVVRFVEEVETAPMDADGGGTLVITPASPQPPVEEESAIPLPVIDELADTGMTIILGAEAELPAETIETKEHQGSSASETNAGPVPVSVAEAELPSASEIDDDTTFVLDREDGETSAHLVCTTGPHAGEVLKLKQGITTMGRASDNTFPLSKDKEASRRHAIIVYEASKFVIQDQNSLNGTFVNDELVKEPRPLQDGDIILIGVSTLKFQER